MRELDKPLFLHIFVSRNHAEERSKDRSLGIFADFVGKVNHF